VCDPHTGTGVPPATVAEWTLQGDGNKDFYDGSIVLALRVFADFEYHFITVSLVDGYNLPLSVTNNVGCPTANCPVDLGLNCEHTCLFVCVLSLWKRFVSGPAPIQGPFEPSGFAVGCKSACEANIDGNPVRSPWSVSLNNSADTPLHCPV